MGTMATRAQPPPASVPPALATSVASVIGFDVDGLRPGVHRGLPSHYLTLVLSLRQPLVTAPDEEAWSAGVRDAQWLVLGGLHTRAAMVEQPGRWAGIQLALHPLGARRLLGVPTAGLPTDRWDARDLLGADEVDRVVEEAHAAPDWRGRYAAVHRFLLRHGAAHREAAPVRPEVRRAWDLLTGPGAGRTRVADVAADVGYSRRRLGRLFAAELGHGPKTVARLGRFHAARGEVMTRAQAGRALDLADLAAGLGYHDQAHLAAEFREFAGLAPTTWLAEEVPNVQGPGASEEAGWTS